MFWLTYRRAGRLCGVLILDGPSLIHARLVAAVRGLDAGADFAEGHLLDAESAASIPAKHVGRMLTLREAERLLPS